TKKIRCGQCGTTFVRKKSRNGFVTWSCLKHIRNASACTVGRIPESRIYAAFVSLYNKLRWNAEAVLQPAVSQLSGLNDVLQKGNPEILAINRAIAEATEKSYKITKVQTAGLIGKDVCTRQLREINTRITELRRERRIVLKNQDIEDLIEALIRTMRTMEAGPDRLEAFDEELFAGLVENVTAMSETCLRFRLYGGIELTERI
ncbi:MAG: zinc ribbon domain-containing protein, partial [Oscillibacter sp.]|nr:zinc ribbon domain-containing protein [Oscillibacter sp.]